MADFSIRTDLINLKHSGKLGRKGEIFLNFGSIFLIEDANADTFHGDDSHDRNNSPDCKHDYREDDFSFGDP